MLGHIRVIQYRESSNGFALKFKHLHWRCQTRSTSTCARTKTLFNDFRHHRFIDDPFDRSTFAISFWRIAKCDNCATVNVTTHLWIEQEMNLIFFYIYSNRHNFFDHLELSGKHSLLIVEETRLIPLYINKY